MRLDKMFYKYFSERIVDRARPGLSLVFTMSSPGQPSIRHRRSQSVRQSSPCRDFRVQVLSAVILVVLRENNNCLLSSLVGLPTPGEDITVKPVNSTDPARVRLQGYQRKEGAGQLRGELSECRPVFSPLVNLYISTKL